MKQDNTVSYKNVNMDDGFWAERQRLNREVTIYNVYDRFHDTGRISAFELNWREGMPNKPHVFYDSDVAKWMESVAYILQKKWDNRLEELFEGLVDLIEHGQKPDGYFNLWFIAIEPSKRFTDRNAHELYCAGHLFEAAVAYFEATGRDRFLKLMSKYADYIAQEFMHKKTAKFATPGHQEIELALVRMYRCTNEQKFLKLARWFLDQRGTDEKDFLLADFTKKPYAQDHAPVREQETAEGHCVRALYLYCAMADIAYETGDEGLFKACRKLYDNIVNKRMYITGGTGSTRMGEAFTIDYDLPNETAYSESCAAIALAMFSRRMLLLDNDRVYADTIEKILYNGFLSSISLNGKDFFYKNPLEINLKNHNRHTSTSYSDFLPITQRVEVFNCSCCPPNIARFTATLGDYMLSHNKNTVFIHQYFSSTSTVKIDGKTVRVNVKTQYPKNGVVDITISGGNGTRFAMRVPNWCEEYHVEFNGEKPSLNQERGYLVFDCDSDEVRLTSNFVMKPILIEANDNVRCNAGRAALQYGPIIYCVEGVDNNDEVHNLFYSSSLNPEFKGLEGIPFSTIVVDGFKKPRENDRLYSPLKKELIPYRITCVPYFTFANRGESDMLVWVPYIL
ncbi:MAG TPA: beta-L-arabinofuranosidase domain-containing protein [Clostridia bacterium]|nr:beta-L-arabinofuranosidase domain-containing protein [Clostridia bacterium]